MAVIKIPNAIRFPAICPQEGSPLGASCWGIFWDVEINLQQLDPSHPVCFWERKFAPGTKLITFVAERQPTRRQGIRQLLHWLTMIAATADGHTELGERRESLLDAVLRKGIA